MNSSQVANTCTNKAKYVDVKSSALIVVFGTSEIDKDVFFKASYLVQIGLYPEFAGYIMKHESIKVERYTSDKQIEFSIVAGKEKEASEYLVTILNENNEISFANDKDEEGEGSTSVHIRNGEYQHRDGGHGWQGEWKPISLQELKALIIGLAPQNNGSHWSLVARYYGEL